MSIGTHRTIEATITKTKIFMLRKKWAAAVKEIETGESLFPEDKEWAELRTKCEFQSFEESSRFAVENAESGMKIGMESMYYELATAKLRKEVGDWREREIARLTSSIGKGPYWSKKTQEERDAYVQKATHQSDLKIAAERIAREVYDETFVLLTKVKPEDIEAIITAHVERIPELPPDPKD